MVFAGTLNGTPVAIKVFEEGTEDHLMHEWKVFFCFNCLFFILKSLTEYMW